MKIEHYIKWLAPGAFFPEDWSEKLESKCLEVLSLKIPRDVYAFSFYDVKIVDAVDEEGVPHEISSIINKSCRYIIGEVFTVDQIKSLGEEFRILASNVSQYETKSGIKTHLGNWQPLLEDDVVLSVNEVTFKEPKIYKNLTSAETTKEEKKK